MYLSKTIWISSSVRAGPGPELSGLASSASPATELSTLENPTPPMRFPLPLPTLRLTPALLMPPLEPPVDGRATRDRLARAWPDAADGWLLRRASAPSRAAGVSLIISLKASLKARTPVLSAFLRAASASSVLGRSSCCFYGVFSRSFSGFFSSFRRSGFGCGLGGSFLSMETSRCGTTATTGRTGGGSFQKRIPAVKTIKNKKA